MNELTKIGKKHGTDKAGPNNYTEVSYYRLLKNKRNDKIKLLELGVGDTGASVKMWREFFPNAEITLFDPFFITHPDVTVTKEELEALNINVVVGNQLDKNDLSKLEAYGEYDIIIDDASHLSDGIQLSFAVLFPYLKKGGLYIVEDLSCAHDRDKRINDVNNWLDSENVNQNIQKIYHRKEIHISHALREYKDTSKWNSTFLLEKQKKYLEDKIDTFMIVPNYNNTEGLAVIKKNKDT